MMLELNISETPKPSQIRRQRRREKSRDAARFRRHKESDTFEEICSTIPIPHGAVNHLDKSAIMRLLISYIKLRQAINQDTPTDHPVVKQEFVSDMESVSGDDYINALNAFILILSSDLDILYVSDNVKQYLGLSKLDLIGQSILTYSHEGDHEDIRNCFSEHKDSPSQRTFFLRLKSTLTVSGKSINLKSAAYKVLRCSGVVKATSAESSYYVAHVEPIPHPSNIQHFLDSKTYVTQHSPDMKITYIEERFREMMNYSEDDLTNRSFFDLCHAADVKVLGDFFHKLYRINQVETNQYRILSKTGGYHWVVTQATVIANQKNQKPQCIVCLHYVISDLLYGETALSTDQWESAKALPPPLAIPSIDQVSLHSLDSDNVEEEMEAVVSKDILNTTPEVEPSSDTDDCSVAPLNFTEMDENENFFGDDIYFNAPSIGDPWSYGTSEELTPEDLFSDVVLDGNVRSQQQPSLQQNVKNHDSNMISFVPDRPEAKFSPQNTLFKNQQCVDVTMTLPLQSPDSVTLSGNSFPPPSAQTNLYATATPSGSLSPCDSAYCGSPVQGQEPLPPYTANELMASVQTLTKPPNYPNKIERHAYQPVTVPRDKYNGHVKNLKRGFVECADRDNAICDWPKMKMKKQEVLKKSPCKGPPSLPTAPSERPCSDLGDLPTPSCLNRAPPKNFSFSDLMNMPSALIQPGDGLGIHDFDNNPKPVRSNIANFLLQPEMNFNEKEGRQLARSISNSILPQLSILDCEVNAPLGRDDNLPLAVDCIHFLDAQI